MKSKSVLMAVVFLFITSTLIAQVTDRDGNIYDTLHFSSQVWLKSNLNVSHFRNGDAIPEIEDSVEWAKAGNDHTPAWCYYNNDASNGKKYGKLYNWYAINDSRGLAPNGWHIPNTVEWAPITENNYKMIAGTKLKSTSGWNDNGNGTNERGFTGLPGGCRDPDGAFRDIYWGAYWWSSRESSPDNGSYIGVGYTDSHIDGWSYANKGSGASIRCLRD